MNLITYLDAHLLSTARLLAASGMSATLLSRLQQDGMAPQPSYRLRLSIDCTSFFGEHSEHCEQDFYATGAVDWLADVAKLTDGAAAFGLFVERYRARVAQLGAEPRTDEYLLSEWQHFLSGTYGLCTRSGLPEAIADKEVAIANIKSIVDNRGEQVLTEDERQYLRHWVDVLDRASAPFAPHEVARSSRRRLVDEVRNTYGLGDGPLDSA
jgi:hypothetical protein